MKQTGRIQTGAADPGRPTTSTRGAGYTRGLGKDPREVECNLILIFSKKQNNFR